MGITIQAESSHCELVYIHTCEHDDDVLEYYDQPSRIKLEYPDRNGRNLGVWHTPDFFVLQKTGAGYIECKEESSLLKLAEKSPHRFVFDEAGYWRCPPGEEYAEQFGLFYRVWTPSNVNPILYRNIEFLSDYLTDEKAR